MSNRDPYTFLNQSSIPKPIITAIHGILKAWDMPTSNPTNPTTDDHSYLNHFHPDGILHVITAEPTKGAAAIKKLHDTMLNPRTGPVVKLQHFCDKVFLMPGRVDSLPPASASASASVPKDIQQGADHHSQTDKSHKTEAIFTGKLTSTLITGEEITTDFATWIVLAPATSLDDTNAEKTGGEGGSKRDADAEPELSLRVEYLRVFSDTCALTAAIAAMGNGK
ncbi:hypothetical protein HRR83_007992 [Exophiala dermatitidis]|uniref:Uncharacterized protein n=2 Tax=Exophiala dermatitidis TaxID=5970 RepID=H6BPG6_EXODN|nr:uncharacterized protein HMPREF1120_02594 [Exophiala dermatitidis NIH/UT8656]KAJ4502134.1 hypothetical protein HRR75_008611 [Exophiala dermatitidis]EHY54425.1 hypothetical protein HMPREF1120_02594 [Exophiala dermatitidis NIH/UT8656]KAJ4502701.1 hypothetical protein HRR73_009355 [Exophiala dermatitidis]KAJ4503239.1 hypothetical protein HRR74_009363 [Exophiala dermatitidis]KAJ4535805.1 hypothetical protein HRR77_007749 [Exophiala dermatitidis]